MPTDAEIAEGQRLRELDAALTWEIDSDYGLTNFGHWVYEHAEALLTGYVELQRKNDQLENKILSEMEMKIASLSAQLDALRQADPFINLRHDTATSAG